MWRFGLWNSFLFIESCEMSQRGGWKTFAKLPGKDRVVKCKLEVKTSRIMQALHFQDYSFKKHGQEKLKELWRWKPRTLKGESTLLIRIVEYWKSRTLNSETRHWHSARDVRKIHLQWALNLFQRCFCV